MDSHIDSLGRIHNTFGQNNQLANEGKIILKRFTFFFTCVSFVNNNSNSYNTNLTLGLSTTLLILVQVLHLGLSIDYDFVSMIRTLYP